MSPVQCVARLAIPLLAALALSWGLSTAAGQSPEELQFADWTSVASNTATGTLRGSPVSFSGPDVQSPPASTVDGSQTVFASSSFTPPLATSDAVYFRGYQSYAYTLHLGSPMRDPVLHLASLASQLDFPSGTSITRVSGESGFSVSGSSVIGSLDSSSDADGTVRLNGTFQDISFSATKVYPADVPDGIYLQVGALGLSESPPPGPSPTPPAPEGNVTLPHIQIESRSHYRCDPGTWQGLAKGSRFYYSWWRLPTKGTFKPGGAVEQDTRVANGPTFTLPEADVGKKFYCSVNALTASGKSIFAYSPTLALSGRAVIDKEQPSFLSEKPYGDVRIRGIDVFQTTQPSSNAQQFAFPGPGAFPSYCSAGTPTSYLFDNNCDIAGNDPGRTAYAGVPLDQRKATTAVVYVDMAGRRAGDPAAQLDVSLSAYVGGRLLSGTVIAHAADRPVSTDPYVSAHERTDPKYGIQFDVPAVWLAVAALNDQKLDLEARVSLPVAPVGAVHLTECLGASNVACTKNDRFRLDEIPVFDDLPELTVRSVALLDGYGLGTLFAPTAVLKSVVDLYPGGERLNIEPYTRQVDISREANLTMADDDCEPFEDVEGDAAAKLRKCRMAAVQARLQKFTYGENFNILLAAHRYGGEPGWKPGETTITNRRLQPWLVVNDGNLGRPMTAAAHEFGHALGLPHADQLAFDPVTEKSCGGNAAGQVAEPWPYDNTGRLQGVAWRRPDPPRWMVPPRRLRCST